MSESYRVMAPDRFITVVPVQGAVVVRHGCQDLLRTSQAIRLSEGDRDDVLYVPLAVVPEGMFEPSSSQYHCRWKGNARFYNVRAGGELVADGAWGYERAPGDLAKLREHVAFSAQAFNTLIDPVTEGTPLESRPETQPVP